MASKKKPSLGKAKTPKEDPIFKTIARDAAAEVTRNWLREPRNRTQVIMPAGKNYKPGTSDYVTKTKGRYKAGGMVYDRTYTDVMNFLKSGGGSSKPVTKTSMKAKKKK